MNVLVPLYKINKLVTVQGLTGLEKTDGVD